MDGRELESKMNYLGMERSARKVLMDEGLASAEEVAMMTGVEVCNRLLESYSVVSCEDEDITIVKNEDMKTYNSIIKILSR